MRLTLRGSGCFFAKFLRTAGRNNSNHTLLERYRREATFLCRTLSLIPYGLRAVSNLLNRGILFFFEIFAIFDTGFALVFEPFVETRRVIRRWNAMDKVQPLYVVMVSRFLTVLS